MRTAEGWVSVAPMLARDVVVILLPFISAIAVAKVARLRGLATAHHRITWPLGVAGLGCLLAAVVGVVPGRYALPLALLGGAVSGFAMFWARRSDDGGDDRDDWRRRHPSPDTPPPRPAGSGPIDWELFDRLRADWERGPVRGR